MVFGTGALVGDVQTGATIMVGPQGGASIGGTLTQSAMVPSIGSSRGGRIVYDGPSLVPSTLAVQGEAMLGGTLLVTVPPQTSQSPGTLISAGGITGAFDAVLVSPALSGDRFLTVNYTTPRQGARMAGTVSLGVASLSGDPELAPPSGFTTPGAPVDAVTADLNSDSFDDVVLVIPGSAGAPGNLTLLISDGAGGFSQQVTVPTAIEPRGVAVGDIDQAGGLDIAVTGFGDDTERLYSTDGLATPTISPAATLTVADLPLLSEPFDVVVGQFNGAGPDDVALTSSGSDIVYLLETKDPMMDPMTDPFEFEPCEVPAGTRPKRLAVAALADLDGDLVADFVVGNTQPGVFGISAITSSGGFTVATYPVGDEPGEVVLRDLNGDGAPDAAAVRPDGDVVSVLRNTGAGVFAPPADLPVGVSPRSLADADLDADADVDLAVIIDDGGGRVVQILRNDTQTAGQLVFAATEQIAAGGGASLVRSGDLNANGRDDLLTLDGGAGVLRGTTQDGNAALLGVRSAGACVADVTTDGSSNGLPDGEVTLSDFSYYLTLWSGRDPIADVTTDGTSNGMPDGEVTLSDFSYYLVLWSAGCP